MKITPITSDANPLLKKVRSLHQRSGREKSGLFLIEGAKVVNEAFAKGVAIKEVLVSQSFLKEGLGDSHAANIESIYVVEDKCFKELVTTEGPCGILALGQIRQSSLSGLLGGKSPLIVIADGIQDPGNLGTMIRTALAARATAMVLTRGTVDPYNPKVVRSAAGALFSLPLVTDITAEEAITAVKERQLKVVACDPTAKTAFWNADLSEPIAIVFGNEGQGFGPGLLGLADIVVSIPMNPKSESLNVAVSAGIILFGALQQRMTAQSAGK